MDFLGGPESCTRCIHFTMRVSHFRMHAHVHISCAHTHTHAALIVHRHTCTGAYAHCASTGTQSGHVGYTQATQHELKAPPTATNCAVYLTLPVHKASRTRYCVPAPEPPYLPPALCSRPCGAIPVRDGAEARADVALV